MMGDQLILEEDYDENYQPTEAEILEYATTVIGIDPETEPHLMWIAREGISAPLPADWKPCQDTSGGDIYYFNFTSGESTWDHPCDEFYRKMVQEERDKPKPAGGSGGPGKKEGKKKKEKKEKKDAGKKSQGTSSSLGPLKDSALGSPLGSLKGTGHLGTLGTLQDPGSTLGSTSGKKDTGFLKKSLDTKSLSLAGNREENIQMLPEFSEDEPTPRLNLDLDLQDIGQLGYEESEASEPALKHLHPSDDESDEDDVNVDFGIDANLSKRLGLMDADSLMPATSPDPPKSRFLKSSKKEAEKGPSSRPPLSLESSLDSPRVPDLGYSGTKMGGGTFPSLGSLAPSSAAHLPKLDNEKLQREAREEEEKLRASMEQSLQSKRAEMENDFEKELEAEEATLRKEQEKSLKLMRERLEKELEDAKLELLEDKEDHLRQLKEEAHKEEEKEEEALEKEKAKSISDLRKRVKEETEEEEAMLMEGKSDALRKLKETIKKEQQTEEDKIREAKDKALKSLRDEVRELREKEEEKLEEEKKKVMDRIKKEAASYQEEKMADLKKGHEMDLDKLKEKLKSEQQSSLDELKKTFEEEIEKKKIEASQKHKRDMDDILSNLRESQEEERRREEEKLRLSRDNQAAIRDMETGMDSVLQERKQALKEEHQKEMERMKKDQEKKIRDMTRELKDAEQDEKKTLQKEHETEKEKLAKIHKSALKVLKEEFEQKKEVLHSSHEDEERALKEVSESLSERKKVLERQNKELEREEEKIARRRAKLEEEKERLQHDQEEVLEMKGRSGDISQMEDMEKERQELVAAIKKERRMLQELEKEKKQMEGKVKSLHAQSRHLNGGLDEGMTNGYHDNPSTPHNARFRRKADIPDTPDVDLLDLNELDPLTPSPTKQVRQMIHPRDLAKSPTGRDVPFSTELDDEDDYEMPRGGRRYASHKARGKRAAYDDDQMYNPPLPSRHRGRHAWQYMESDASEEFDDATARRQMAKSDLRLRLAEENGAISRAKDFLKRQKRQLHQQKSALEDAKTEWRRDLRQGYEENGDTIKGTPLVYEDVRLGLEREALELDKALVNYTTGSRLVREKESKLKKLEESLNDKDIYRGRDIGQHSEANQDTMFILSDSSGSSPRTNSSTSGDESYKQDIRGHHSKKKGKVKGMKQDESSQVISSLNSLNNQLQNVMTVLKQRELPNAPGGPTPGSYSTSPTGGIPLQNGAHVPYSHPPHKYANPHSYAPPPQSALPRTSYAVPSTGPLPYHGPAGAYDYSSASRRGLGGGGTERPYTVGGGRLFDPVNPQYGMESAEQAMGRKWRKYFGDERRAGAPGFPVTGNEKPTFGGYISARDQLRSFRDPGPMTSRPVPTSTDQSSGTQNRLVELNDWLKKHRMSGALNVADLEPTVSGSESRRSANNSIAGTSLASQKPAQTRLELDSNNQIRVREVR
ncbi:centrosomal protein of 164 kDa-like [Lytechinus pictus]|uniref:centrosomal protein of 164 kDa-like n=1 Tax=Lytechinus pictus TaxID=7653 RepID=UPI0030B9AE29